jgi:hypothetical protein
LLTNFVINLIIELNIIKAFINFIMYTTINYSIKVFINLIIRAVINLSIKVFINLIIKIIINLSINPNIIIRMRYD